MNTETQAITSCPPAAEEIVWLQALHAVELCQLAAELAARVHLLGTGGTRGTAWPSAVPVSAASSAG
jgi:hypothetical protein